MSPPQDSTISAPSPDPIDFSDIWLRIRESVLLKAFTVMMLLMLSLLPIPFILDLVHERQSLQKSAIEEVNQKWAGQQTLTGPILSIPYRTTVTTIEADEQGKSKKVVQVQKHFHILPEDLSYTGSMTPQILNRGIYEMIVYSTELKLQGHFKLPSSSHFPVPMAEMLWDKAYISMGISDLGGIEDNIQLSWQNTTLTFDPGPVTESLYSSGIHHPIPLNLKQFSQPQTFALRLKIRGNQRLYFSPVGKETRVKLSSDWQNPSFSGAFLPDARQVSQTGFQAEWKVLQLNRNYPQNWSDNQYQIADSAFGVYLLQPVDHYHKTLRSVKYALFFMGLTFLIFFFVEVLTRRQVHPLQYLLVGFALCVFYTLLLSISEHLGFDQAYLIAAAMTLTLISSYASGFLKSRPLTLMTAGILATLFGFIYTIIQQQDYALLMGSLGLFVVLALVMFFSRKIEWNRVSGRPISSTEPV